MKHMTFILVCLFAVLTVSCSRPDEEKSSLKITLPANSIFDMSTQSLKHVVINITGDSMKEIFVAKNFFESTFVENATIEIKDIPMGNNRLIQVLAIYSDETSMTFNYGDALTPMDKPEKSIAIRVFPISSSSGTYGQLIGRILPTNDGGPTGQVAITFQPPTGIRAMKIGQTAIYGGWLNAYFVDGGTFNFLLNNDSRTPLLTNISFGSPELFGQNALQLWLPAFYSIYNHYYNGAWQTESHINGPGKTKVFIVSLGAAGTQKPICYTEVTSATTVHYYQEFDDSSNIISQNGYYIDAAGTNLLQYTTEPTANDTHAHRIAGGLTSTNPLCTDPAQAFTGNIPFKYEFLKNGTEAAIGIHGPYQRMVSTNGEAKFITYQYNQINNSLTLTWQYLPGIIGKPDSISGSLIYSFKNPTDQIQHLFHDSNIGCKELVNLGAIKLAALSTNITSFTIDLNRIGINPIVDKFEVILCPYRGEEIFPTTLPADLIYNSLVNNYIPNPGISPYPTTTPVASPTPSLMPKINGLALGGMHTCVKTEANTVGCFGANSSSQLGTNMFFAALPQDVININNAVNVVTKGNHTCALLSDGMVQCWGQNQSGQLGNNSTSTNRNDLPQSVMNLSSPVSMIAASSGNSGSHTCALLSNGDVKCWGANFYGQLGDGTTTNTSYPQSVTLSGAASIAAGNYHSCALLSPNQVICWGDNYYGQIGDGTSGTNRLTPTNVDGLSSDVAQITAGDFHTCARLSDGTVKCWGFNGNGRLGDSTNSDRHSPTLVIGLTGVNQIVAGGTHTCALISDFTVKCWGWNYYGQLGIDSSSDSYEPAGVLGLTNVTKIVAGDQHTCALHTDGRMQCWGHNEYGQLGINTTSGRLKPTEFVNLENIADIAAGQFHTCARLASGQIKCWGRNDYGQLGAGIRPQFLTSISNVDKIVAGFNHSCTLSITDGVKCWGSNSSGQIGDNTFMTTITTPTSVYGLTIAGLVQDIAAGGQHNCALTSYGAVKCWGLNSNGQIGDGSSGSNRLAPTDVTDLTGNVIKITTGGNHSCALLTGGIVKCWGSNTNGQIGDNTTTDRLVPTNVTDLGTDVTTIEAGSYHTCSLTSAGGVKCWGENSNGQLGDGTTTERRVPVLLTNLASGVSKITTGYQHTCALLTGGSVKCWGYNMYGQLGDGTTINRVVPTGVTGLTNVSDIKAGINHTCALLEDGSIKCWGENYYGQTGKLPIGTNMLVP